MLLVILDFKGKLMPQGKDNEGTGFRAVSGLVQTLKVAEMDASIASNLERAKDALKDLANVVTTQCALLMEITQKGADASTIASVHTQYNKCSQMYHSKLSKFVDVSLRQAETMLDDKERTAKLLKELDPSR